MIIDSKQGNIEVVGDIKEFKTSIDPRNLEFITTLLSSNLYSDPEQSFIREIVSNAWDSHVEAGTTNVPVIIKFRDTPEDKSVTIRDYGTGLSPERFQEVYCMIGSSTKRESNEYIGGFGIGKYSSLACSNTVYITSYYEGIAYYYVMVKSGNQITTNLFMNKPTTEKNGVEITIKGIDDLKPFDKALQYIVFFPNIYIDGAKSAYINSAKLKRFKNFAAASMGESIPSKLLLGNVLYKCDKYHLSSDAQMFLSAIEYTGIVIKFDVGEINITPNRESIIYSTDTIKIINERIMAAKEELEAMINTYYTKDYDDIREYYNAICETKIYDPILGETSSIGFRVNLFYNTCNITYKGYNLKKDITKIRDILQCTLPNYKGTIDGNRIVKKLSWMLRDRSKLINDKVLILNKDTRLIASLKIYLKDNYDSYSIMTDITRQDFEKWLNIEYSSFSASTSNNYKIIIDGIYESLKTRAETLNVEKDKDYIAFKKKLSTNKLSGIIREKEAILYVNTEYGYKEKKSFKLLSQAVMYIKGLKKGIILTGMDANEHQMSQIAALKGYTFIKARKDIVSDIRKLNLKCIVDMDWLINKDPLLTVVNTLAKHFPGEMVLSDIQDISYNIDKREKKEFVRLYTIYKKFKENPYYYGLVKRKEFDIDPYTEYLCLRLKNYIKKHKEVKNLISHFDCNDPIIVTAVVMLTKAYRISGEAYNRVKNNKLIRILCRKS